MPGSRATAAAPFTERAARVRRPGARPGARLLLALAALCAVTSGPLTTGRAVEAAEATVRAASGAQVSAGDSAFYGSFDRPPSVPAMTALGRALFFDRNLSASGRMACATCHDPARAYGPPNDHPAQSGGPDGQTPGVRSVPSLMYQQNLPPFTEHSFESDENDGADQGPAGGRMWDGRAESAHDQARLPLLSALEMANASPEAVVAKVEHAAYAAQFRAAFGEDVFADRGRAFKAVLLALETYQQSAAEFYPYTSKYDAYLRGAASLTAQERRGLEAFDDPARGNCARCHPSAVREGALPQFTDFGYAAIGAPRNPAIAANTDPRYHDLGLCGPLRRDLEERTEYCGLFKTPTLRNVAVKRVFLHNGVFHELEDVVRFYAERDTAPAKWYPAGPNGVLKFDDLPAAYRGNVDAQPPFGRRAGATPALSEADIGDIVAFLRTLTDGYTRRRP
jgi:cytochrome c peroxidase